MAKSRGRKFAELVAPANGVFAAASIPTIAISKLAASTFSVNSESASLGGNVVLDSNDVTEHSSALYFTNTRADTRADARIVAHSLLARSGGTMTGNLTLGDNVNAYFGASTDLRIYHDGTNSHIINSTGELRFTGSNLAFKSDSAKLYFGLSDDLKIYHTGSHSYIENGTGTLFLDAAQVNILDGANTAAAFTAAGATTLYNAGSAKLATTSGGVTVTGTLTATTLAGTLSTAAQTNITSVGTLTALAMSGALTINTGSSGVPTINLSHSNASADNFQILAGTPGVSNGGFTIRDVDASVNRFVIDANGAISFNNAFTFPTSDGSANQILQTNGSGTLSWVANSGGSSQWTASGSDIYYTSGDVGIGINAPTHKLHVKNDNDYAAKFGGTGGGDYSIEIGQTGTNASAGFNATGSSGSMLFKISDSEKMRIKHDGYVGIGTNNPTSILHIEGSTNAYNTSPLLYFGSTSTANAGVRDWAIGPADSGYGNFHIFRGASTGASPIGNAGTVFTIDNAGQVGLGKTGYFIPAAPLHVNSATDGKILISGSNDPYIRWQEGTTNKGYLQWNAAGYFELRNEETSANFTLGNAFSVNATTDQAFLLSRAGSPNVYQTIRNTSTSGTHSYLQLTTYNSSSAQNHGYLIKNAAQNTGNSLGNNSLYLWNQTNEVEFVPAGTIGKRTTLDTNGDLTVRAAGSAAATGILGEGYTSYFGLRHGSQTKDSEYMILSDDTHTYITASSGSTVIIRSGGNDSGNQLTVGSGSTGLSWRGNTVWTAENDGSGSGLDADTLDGQDSLVYFKGYSNVSGWQNSNKNFSVRGGGTGSVGLHMEISDGTFGFQLYGNGSYYGFLDGEWASWDVRKTINGVLEVDIGSGLVHVLTSPENNIPSSYFTRGPNVYGVFPGASGFNLDTVFTTTTNRAGFIDAWSGSNFPSGMSHVQGLQVRHNSSNSYGIQLVGQYNVDGDLRIRNVDNGTFTGWYKVWTSNTDGSGSGLDADTVDGLEVQNTQGTQSTANQILRTQVNGYTMLGWINTPSGDSGLANDIDRIYCTHANDNYIRYLGKSDFKVLIGNSGQTTYDRRDYTSNSLYFTGANSHNDCTYNQLLERGCGFNDNWNSGTGRPPTTGGGHFNGFTATHYASGTSYFHGMQLAMASGNPAYTYLRGWWANGGSGYTWQRIWTDGNDGSGSGLDADLLDGLNAKAVGGSTGASQVLTSNTNSYLVHQNWIDIGSAGIYSSNTHGAHWYPCNVGSYGTWRMAGAKGGYSGIYQDTGATVTGMMDSSGNGGTYHQGDGVWHFYWHRSNGCLGVANSVTSSSYGLYEQGGGIYSTGNIVAYSDRRIKENIVPIDSALEKVNKLAGVYYNRIDDEKKTREIGFIAQDVNEVTPELVTYAEDVDQYGVKYGNTTALLVEAVKELTQQVKDLKQELEELKNG